eukprot:g17915.t1
MAPASSQPVSFARAAEDPLLRAEIAKRDKAREATHHGAAETDPTEPTAEKDKGSAENVEEAAEKTAVPNGEDAAARREKALAKESVSNRVLRAVLRGDMEGLTEAIKRKRLKGVAVALTEDDRKRTALHMAAGIKNVGMARALMKQWRRELNRSLEDELDSLGQRRDMFIQEALSSSTTDDRTLPGGEKAAHDIEYFQEWLSEERLRLVRVTELRCEECWRKAITARDTMGRTPLHYAAAAGTGATLLQTLLTTGRADLCARDASNGRDLAIFSALKEKLNRAPMDRKWTSIAFDDHHLNNPDQCARGSKPTNPLVFPGGGEFHRRTGKIRRYSSRAGRGEAEAKGGSMWSRDEQAKQVSDPRKGPDGLTADTAKVKWFCGALGKTAERLSGRTGGGAEAFLLSVFEDLDRHGNGTLSMGRFREALDDVNVRVSEETLLEVGRYFRAPTLEYHRSHHGNHSSGYRSTQGNKGTPIDCKPVEMSYIPLMDIVFGRKRVREPTTGVLNGEDATSDDPQRGGDGSPGHNLRQAIAQPGGRSASKGRDERTDDNDRCYVNAGRILAARVAVIETPDALGRSPLFLAAAADSVAAVKTLIRHGAASSLAVDGTGLTPYSVAPSSLMRSVLAGEARHSLYQAISKRSSGRHLAGGAKEDGIAEQEATGHELAASLDDPAKTLLETQRMETWVLTLAEGEQSDTTENKTRVDQKTSLHLAATAGLPEVVKHIVCRGMGEPKGSGRLKTAAKTTGGAGPARPAWKTSWKPPEHICGEPRLNTAHHALDHRRTFCQDLSNEATSTTDANGWSALHASCDEASSRHYTCALALLGSQKDPNARTNTGRTPLHVAAAGGASSAEVRGVGDLIPMLVSHGADLEARDGEGLRPIHVAAKTGRHVALLALLAAGADAWSVTPRKWNALHYSIAGGHLETTRLLAYWDADSGVFSRQKNSAGVTAMDLGRTNEIRSATPNLWEAAALGDVEHVSRVCLESARSLKDVSGKPWACPRVNHKTPGLGFTPLHACIAGLAAVTRGVDALDARCRTPLALAAAAGSLEVVETLIKAGADTRAVDVDGNTPLHFAFAYANAEIGAVLLEEGADLEACSGSKKTPRDVAGLCADLALGGESGGGCDELVFS